MNHLGFCHWLSLLLCLLAVLTMEGSLSHGRTGGAGLITNSSPLVGITYVETAIKKGAVCLDGSPPAYHHDKGFGLGADNWLIHLEGGGWCKDVNDCLTRSKMFLGSSKYMPKAYSFTGVLSNNEMINPEFYNWNRVLIKYCDGSSFTGDIEAVDPATNLHFRGGRIFDAVVEDLLAKGMKNAKNALLSGCSAGGMASILHCDNFRGYLPNGSRVKCISDAGYILSRKGANGTNMMENMFKEVAALHGSAKNLPPSCTSKQTPSSCLFPQNVVYGIQTPLFILNSVYDAQEIQHNMEPQEADPIAFRNCIKDTNTCNLEQRKHLQDLRQSYLSALPSRHSSKSRGMFINSCLVHCQSDKAETWNGLPKLKSQTISQAVGNWFYDRSNFQKIDYVHDMPQICTSTKW